MMPESLARKHGPFVFTLNLTETGVKSLRNLVYFTHLKTLILDNNFLEVREHACFIIFEEDSSPL